MKIVLCHNYYQQPGGEDHSFAAEAELLEGRGHEVIRYTLHNDAIHDMSRWRVAVKSIWNASVYRELRHLFRRERPDLMHCTNTFPLISPAAYYAARAEKVPVVQSLRNYRLLCANAQFLRNGAVCEDCLGKCVGWAGIRHGCYRSSRMGTAVVGGISSIHRLVGTWTRAVDLYFTLTDFARQKFIEGGLPADKIFVKPNFIDPDPGIGRGRGGQVVFVGRLSPEKGLDTLLDAWAGLKEEVPLKIIGDGPLSGLVAAAAQADARIEWLGQRSPCEVFEVLGEAACLVMPSVWYETFGRTIIEAFAKGTPVIASRLGAMAELVDDGRTGLHFTPSSPDDLRAKVQQLFADRARQERMRHAARAEYESKYTGQRNIDLLLDVYQKARRLARHGRRARGSATAPGLPSAKEADFFHGR